MIQICNSFATIHLEIEMFTQHKWTVMRQRAPRCAFYSCLHFQARRFLWESAQSLFRKSSESLHVVIRVSYTLILRPWLDSCIRFPWQLKLKGWWRMGSRSCSRWCQSLRIASTQTRKCSNWVSDLWKMELKMKVFINLTELDDDFPRFCSIYYSASLL